MHDVRFFAMDRGNCVVVGGFLVLCMGSYSVLWADVILLGLLGCLCYAWAQILCYGQR